MQSHCISGLSFLPFHIKCLLSAPLVFVFFFLLGYIPLKLTEGNEIQESCLH